MNKTIQAMAVLLFTVTLATTSISSAGYGMAGCGLGSIVFKELKLENNIVQIFAATTNGTYGNQTFGITTGTSHCTGSGAAYRDKVQEVFVSTNYDSLEQQIAAGKGEKLDALASLFGCPKSNSSEFNKVAKANYSKLFNGKDSSPNFLIFSLKEEVSKNSTLKSSCTL